MSNILFFYKTLKYLIWNKNKQKEHFMEHTEHIERQSDRISVSCATMQENGKQEKIETLNEDCPEQAFTY